MASSPHTLWKADDAPIVYINAAYKTKQTKARIRWTNYSVDNAFHRFDIEKSTEFDIIGDGRFRTYTVDVGAVSGYRGALSYLMFQPVLKGEEGAWIKIKRIWLGK